MLEILKEKGDIGRVFNVKDGVVRLEGLENVMANEMLEFSNNIFGLALNLEKESVGALIFGSDRFINAKDFVFRTGKILKVPVGWKLLGRVIDPLGFPLDGKGLLNTEWEGYVEKKSTWNYRKRKSLSIFRNRD